MQFITSLTTFAADKACEHGFFGLPTWYKYLDVKAPACTIDKFKIPGDFSLVALAVAEILLRIAGIVAVAFVIWGGIQYVLSQGEPDKTKSALQTIINALVGLVIALLSTGIVAFVGGQLAK